MTHPIKNETSAEVTSADLVTADLSAATANSTPALEPFELMYGIESAQKPVKQLVIAPNPRMLDGIWKKQPSKSLLAWIRSWWK